MQQKLDMPNSKIKKKYLLKSTVPGRIQNDRCWFLKKEITEYENNEKKKTQNFCFV